MQGQGYATEVVITEKLLPDGFEGRLRQCVEPAVLEPGEDQGYASVLPAVGANKQP